MQKYTYKGGETMKMNKKIIALVALVFGVVITGYSVAGTYAKYTSNLGSTKTDYARAAKWALNAPNSLDLFANSYFVGGTKTGSDTIVKSTEKVIAPGTKGQVDIVITGEVETNFNLSIENFTATGSLTSEDYKPIRFSLDNEKWFTIDQLQTQLNTALNTSKVYPAGKYGNNSGEYKVSVTLYWHWVFDSSNLDGDNGTGIEISKDDKDTEAATNTKDINISLILKATQSNQKADPTIIPEE